MDDGGIGRMGDERHNFHGCVCFCKCFRANYVLFVHVLTSELTEYNNLYKYSEAVPIHSVYGFISS